MPPPLVIAARVCLPHPTPTQTHPRSLHDALPIWHPLDRLIIAGRLAGEGMSGTPPVAAQFTMESSEGPLVATGGVPEDRKSTPLNSSHLGISYAVFCLKKKIDKNTPE